MLRSAPFETPPAAAPQDKLERVSKHAPISTQLCSRRVNQFLTASSAGTTKEARPPLRLGSHGVRARPAARAVRHTKRSKC